MAKKKSKKKSAKSSAASVVKAIQDWSESKLDEKPKIYTPAQVKKLGVTPAPSAVGVMLTEDGYFLPRAMADMYDSDMAYDTLDAFSSYLEGLGYTWTGLEDDPYGTWYEIIPLTAANPIDWDVPVEAAARVGAAAKRAGARVKRKLVKQKGPPSTQELIFRAEDWRSRARGDYDDEVYLRSALEHANRAHAQASNEGDRDLAWEAKHLAAALRRELSGLTKKNPRAKRKSRIISGHLVDSAQTGLAMATKVLKTYPRQLEYTTRGSEIPMLVRAFGYAESAIEADPHRLENDRALLAEATGIKDAALETLEGLCGRRGNPERAKKFIRKALKSNPILSQAEMSEFWSRAADERLAEAMGFADVYEWEAWKAEQEEPARSVVARVMARKKKAKAARKKNPKRGTTTTAQARAILSRAMRGA